MFIKNQRNLWRVILLTTLVLFLSACQLAPSKRTASGTSTPPAQAGSETPAKEGTAALQELEKAKQQGLVPAASGKADSETVHPGYRIGPEDMLGISVWKEPELQREVLVRPDGGISFPLAGNLQAAGRTVQEVEVEITQKIRRYIPDAVVTVSVKKISGYTVFVIGKVNEPGQFTLGRYVDVIQALTLAGGLTPFAADDDITVLRRENGKEVVFPFDYSDVKKGRKLKQNILLKSGDVVVVP